MRIMTSLQRDFEMDMLVFRSMEPYVGLARALAQELGNGVSGEIDGESRHETYFNRLLSSECSLTASSKSTSRQYSMYSFMKELKPGHGDPLPSCTSSSSGKQLSISFDRASLFAGKADRSSAARRW